jgi:hypothetical protein
MILALEILSLPVLRNCEIRGHICTTFIDFKLRREGAVLDRVPWYCDLKWSSVPAPDIR